jgi:hypothetical protein
VNAAIINPIKPHSSNNSIKLSIDKLPLLYTAPE